MSNTTISPNMNMPIPVVGTDPGPDWANNINASLGIVDSHNHTTGEGVPITPGAININTDLPINGNNLTTLRSVRFTPQTTVLTAGADLGCLYEVNADLYYNDGAGNNIRITQSGSVAGSSGTITGLPSGTASAAYSAGTFTFQSATNTPASFAVGPTTIAQAIASGKSVTLSVANSQPSNYGLVFPITLPASIQSGVVSDTSGNLSFLQLISGTYSPTVTTGNSGTAQAALGPFFYQRIGNIVTVSGTLTGSIGFGTSVSWLVTLPFNPSSTFVNTYDIAGTMGNIIYLSHSTNGVAIHANVGTNQVSVDLELQAGTGTVTPSISFTYSCA